MAIILDNLAVVEGVYLDNFSPDYDAADFGAFALSGDGDTSLVRIFTADTGITIGLDTTPGIGLSLMDSTSVLEAVETADRFSGLAEVSSTDDDLLAAAEAASLAIEGVIGKTGLDDETTLTIVESVSLAQFLPTAQKAGSDSADLSSVELASPFQYDAVKAGLDQGSLAAAENSILTKSGTVQFLLTDAGIFVASEIPNVTKQKYAFDFFNVIASAESVEIVPIQYDPGWEDDDVPWGGILLGAKDAAPIYSKDGKFYVLARNGAAYLDGYLERRALIHANGRYVIGRRLAPQIIGADGSVVRIWMGAHNSPNGAIDWEGPYNFVIGQDNFVDFAVSGKYLAVRFESSAIPPWTLQSYEVDYQVIGKF